MENSLDTKISIIIPVLNAEKYMKQCLDALGQLEYPKDNYEVIVVDNGSSDRTLDIARKNEVRIVTKTRCTISALRNYGAEQSQGEVLAFIDADCVAPRAWLKDAIKIMDKNNAGAVGAWYALPENPAFLEKVWDTHMGLRRDISGRIDWVPSGNLIVRKDVYKGVGGFDEQLTTAEDVDICERVNAQERKLYADPRLAVVHLGNSKDLRHFFTKELWRGKGVIQNLLRGKFRGSFTKAVALALVTFLLSIGCLIGLYFWVVHNNAAVFSLSCIGLFIIPVGLSLKAIRRGGDTSFFLPLVFLFFIFELSRACSLVWGGNSK